MTSQTEPAIFVFILTRHAFGENDDDTCNAQTAAGRMRRNLNTFEEGSGHMVT
jgi:hypothetical protein